MHSFSKPTTQMPKKLLRLAALRFSDRFRCSSAFGKFGQFRAWGFLRMLISPWGILIHQYTFVFLFNILTIKWMDGIFERKFRISQCSCIWFLQTFRKMRSPKFWTVWSYWLLIWTKSYRWSWFGVHFRQLPSDYTYIYIYITTISNPRYAHVLICEIQKPSFLGS